MMRFHRTLFFISSCTFCIPAPRAVRFEYIFYLIEAAYPLHFQEISRGKLFMLFDCLVYFKRFCTQPVVSRALQYPYLFEAFLVGLSEAAL